MDWATTHAILCKQTSEGDNDAELQNLIWEKHDVMRLDEISICFLMYYGVGWRREQLSKTSYLVSLGQSILKQHVPSPNSWARKCTFNLTTLMGIAWT